MEDKKNILIVDDERKIVEFIKAYLEYEGYNIYCAYNGEEALDIFYKNNIHLIILDLMLPKLSGEKVCEKIRASSDIPIIMLTAKVWEEDKIKGLYIGADDYITKPFSARELVGRVRAIMRRAYKDTAPLADYLVFNDGDLEIDIKKFTIKKKGEFINLTPNEFKLLKVFLTNPGQVFTREQLLGRVYGDFFEGFDRTIDSHIKNIRHKIEDNPKKPIYIITIYGVGYKFGGTNT